MQLWNVGLTLDLRAAYKQLAKDQSFGYMDRSLCPPGAILSSGILDVGGYCQNSFLLKISDHLCVRVIYGIKQITAPAHAKNKNKAEVI